MCFDALPFIINDAEIDGVADASGVRDHVIAKRAFCGRADA